MEEPTNNSNCLSFLTSPIVNCFQMGQNRTTADETVKEDVSTKEAQLSNEQFSETLIETHQTSSSKFPWDSLPQDVKINILRRISIPDLLTEVQKVFVHDTFTEIDYRIRKLQPLYKLWVESPTEVRNTTPYRSRAARQACTPIEFCKLERLILSSSRLSGCLTPAVAELAATLKVLHLDDNQLDTLPEELTQCQHLLLLDCSNNSFKNFPSPILKIPSLKHVLFPSNKQLTLIPREINALTSLNTLSFYTCGLTELPSELIALALAAERFTLNVASNNFPRNYLARLCQTFPRLRSRLAHVVIC